ncbi:MAG: YceI family protein [Bacteriovoracaceae bacterium]|nr:YceI family protein [Bacteriovoracaceae bacterium]
MKFYSPILFTAVIFFTNSALAATCKYHYNNDASKVSWVAFKTPKKVGVNVAFDKITITPKKLSAKRIEDLVEGSTFTIDTTTVNSKNPERDEKLKNFFFTSKGKPVLINGKVLSFKDNLLEVELKINDSKKNIIMKTSIADKNFSAIGSIDVLDFALSENLGLINEACKELHEGKTWSDVEIKIESAFEQKCK